MVLAWPLMAACSCGVRVPQAGVAGGAGSRGSGLAGLLDQVVGPCGRQLKRPLRLFGRLVGAGGPVGGARGPVVEVLDRVVAGVVAGVLAQRRLAGVVGRVGVLVPADRAGAGVE